jgi:hypothetical protein
MRSSLVDKQRGVGAHRPKSNGDDELREMKPSVRCLFESVKGLGQSTYCVWHGDINKHGRLVTEHMFLQVTVKKNIGDIKLSNGPMLVGCYGEHHPNCARLDDRGKRLAEVDSRLLCETTDNPSCLVFVEAAIRAKFVLEHPFPRHDVGVRWPGNQLPSAISQEGIELCLHCTSPVRIGQAERTDFGIGERETLSANVFKLDDLLVVLADRLG